MTSRYSTNDAWYYALSLWGAPLAWHGPFLASSTADAKRQLEAAGHSEFKLMGPYFVWWEVRTALDDDIDKRQQAILRLELWNASEDRVTPAAETVR